MAIPAATAAIGGALGLALRSDPVPGGSVRELTVPAGQARAVGAQATVRRLPGWPVAVTTTRDGREWALLQTRGGGRIARLDLRRHRARLLPARLDGPVELIDEGERATSLAFATRDGVGTVSATGAIAFLRQAPGVGGVAFDVLGQLWYTSHGDGLVQLDPIHGTIRRSRVGMATRRRLGDIALVAGGDVWLRDDGGRVGRASGSRVRWTSLPVRPGDGAVAGDPVDGVWTSWPGAVARTRADRERTVFRLPPSFGRPGALVSGPDGNVWCAARHGARLARFAPDGGVAFFHPRLPAGASVTDITRRPSRLIVATRGPAGVYDVSLRDLRSKLTPR